jgi:membrane-bound lytic murein transglycosylase D
MNMQFKTFLTLFLIFCFQNYFALEYNIDSLLLQNKEVTDGNLIINNVEDASKTLDYQIITDREKLNKYNFSLDSIPYYSDLIYEYRLAKLNSTSPIQYEYNNVVRKYIDLYSIKRRHEMSKILGLAELYFPIFEQMLSKYDLPLELKYLAIVESALNPTARSKSDAVGLWQFLLPTCELFDLNVTSYVDERCDVYKSTEAACRYLDYLYRIYGDWQLALASYNGGPGAVKNAIIRSGGKTNFWEIRPYLTAETQNYVPAFIAASYIMNFNIEHNIFPKKPAIYFHETDTVMVKHAVKFNQISSYTGVSNDMLKMLNPAYKTNYIPYFDKPMTLILPNDKVAEYLKFEQEIYGNKQAEPIYTFAPANPPTQMKIIHKVAKGEYFHKIAIRYNCTSEDIIAWNNLKSNNLNEGQLLTIYVKSQTLETETQTSNYFYYTVQPGDNITSIATKFKCASVTDLIKANDIADAHKIEPGTKLKIINSTQK